MKEYKGFKYGCDNGVWFVQVHEDGSKFIVALDDSKLCGYRKFIESENNEAACLRYVDWVVSVRARRK